MTIKIELTVCSECDKFLDFGGFGTLNEDLYQPGQCDICKKKLETEHGYLPAYDHELDLESVISMILKKLYGR